MKRPFSVDLELTDLDNNYKDGNNYTRQYIIRLENSLLSNNKEKVLDILNNIYYNNTSVNEGYKLLTNINDNDSTI